MQIYTFHEAEKLVLDFEEILARHNIKIEQGSDLEGLCLTTLDLVDKYNNPSKRDPTIDIRQYFRDIIGLQDLIAKIVKSSKNPNFEKLIPHLKRLNESTPLQNIRTSVLSQDNNKIFELYIACLCLNIDSADIEVDNPDYSTGDNPDIISNINGKKWGFGCKAIHSPNPLSIVSNIEKAIDQIEKSISDVGLPIINLKNIIIHNDYWPILNEQNVQLGEVPEFVAFKNYDIPLQMLVNFVVDLFNGIIETVGRDNLEKLFEGKKSQPACLFYTPTATAIVINDNPVPVSLNVFQLIPLGVISEECQIVLKSLNHELQLR